MKQNHKAYAVNRHKMPRVENLAENIFFLSVNIFCLSVTSAASPASSAQFFAVLLPVAVSELRTPHLLARVSPADNSCMYSITFQTKAVVAN